MPKQVGLIKINGNVDDLSFYETQDGFMARKKGRFSIDKFKNDPNYLLTRLNASEFGIGGNAGRVLREAFHAEINRASDGRVISRVTQTMIAILQADTGNDYGQRQVQEGDMSLLESFDFNIAVPFFSMVKASLTASVDRTTGLAEINIPAFIPQEDIAAPSGATHFRIFAAAAAIDFQNDNSITARQSTGNLVYGNTATAVTDLALTLPTGSTVPWVIICGVEFKKVINGKDFPFSKKASALAVLTVDQP